MHTEMENAQLEVIESKVHLDVEEKRITVEYPFIEDPAILGNVNRNNKNQVIATQRSVENSAIKNGFVEAHNGQVKKALDKGTISIVSHEELQPVNYTFGKSLNQLMRKGPSPEQPMGEKSVFQPVFKSVL